MVMWVKHCTLHCLVGMKYCTLQGCVGVKHCTLHDHVRVKHCTLHDVVRMQHCALHNWLGWNIEPYMTAWKKNILLSMALLSWNIVPNMVMWGETLFLTWLCGSETFNLTWPCGSETVSVFAFAFDFVESLGLSGLKKVESQAIFISLKNFYHRS